MASVLGIESDRRRFAHALFITRQAATVLMMVAIAALIPMIEGDWAPRFLAMLVVFVAAGFALWGLLAARVMSPRVALHGAVFTDTVLVSVTIARTPDPAQFAAAFLAILAAASVAFPTRVAAAYVGFVMVCGLGAVAAFGDRDMLPSTAATLAMIAAVSIVLLQLRRSERDAQQELARNERQLRRAEEVARLGSWQWCPETGELLWSRNMFRLLGRDPDAGQPDFAAWTGGQPAERLAEMMGHARATLETGEDYAFDSVYESPDGGDRRILQARGSRVVDAEGRLWLVGTAQDVTELRRVDELKDEFVATASHELRTPATIVLGSARTLDDRWDDLDESTRRTLVRQLRTGGERMSRLIEDVLSVSRIEHGDLRLVPERIVAGDVVEEVVAALGDPRVTADVAPDARGALVHADPDRLRQVLFNLVENALRYDTSGRGVEVDLMLDEGGERLLARVVDRGPGVAPEERERIFRRFARGNASAGTTENGTGLGLYVARSLVERQGGHLWVEPRADGEPGSSFCFTLPVVDRSGD